MKVSWREFKDIASEHLEHDGAFIYRGQRDASWVLKTSLHRTSIASSIEAVKTYVDVILPKVQEPLEAWVGRNWNLKDTYGLAEFLAFIQHNGFPTPLLDWTFSPYIAAYFAFESINHFHPQNKVVAIYSLNQRDWGERFKQVYDVADFTPHVSILRPRIVGNHKLALQQGCFTWSNVDDIESHIRFNEQNGQSFLTKYELDVEERPKVMRELSLMGISAVQLMPSVEAVCKKTLEDLIGLSPLDPSKAQ
ncbi:MAG TPA: FRG domain-containing protein [Gallionella sp.]|nr:FRG domain-containing protein [Gallionella sp.]